VHCAAHRSAGIDYDGIVPRDRAFSFAAAFLLASHAGARPTRFRFEPTDLRLEPKGMAELDLQVGVTHGDGSAANRVILPDFEFDLGLTPNVELNIDGAFGFDRYDQTSRRYVGEPLWTGVKLGFGEFRNAAQTQSFAIGMQLGPRFPTVGDTRGVGYGALALFGLNARKVHTALNAGGFVDPGPEITRGQPKSLLGGIFFVLDLDEQAVWTFDAELAVAYHSDTYANEVSGGLGVSYDPSKNLELQLIGIAGFLPGYDRLTLLAGMTPKFDLF
jgi:hypothetical protein